MALVSIEKQGHVALVTLRRPEALNALNGALLGALDEAVAAIGADDEIRAVVLTGEGKAFVAGADVSEMAGMASEEAAAYGRLGTDIFARLEALPQPVIAAVNGFALGGGCELALACDIRIASEKAKFAQPEVGLGITPGFGGTQRLPRAVGMSRAMEMILTARMVDAQAALSMGLVSAVYPPESLLEEAMKLAESIAKGAPAAVRAAKRAMHKGIALPLDKGIEEETALFAACFDTTDQKEAMAAFVEKRKAAPFTGK